MAEHPTTEPDEDEYGKVETPDHPTPRAPDDEGEPTPDEHEG